MPKDEKSLDLNHMEINSNTTTTRTETNKKTEENKKINEKYSENTIREYVRKGETKQILSKLATEIIQDFNDFTISADAKLKDSMILSSTALESFIQATAEEKRKLDALKQNESIIEEKLKMINEFKSKFI